METAKNNEALFRMILDEFAVEHKGLSLEQIHIKYSEGRRYGIWTILNFEEKEPNIFEFSSENIAALSGRGRSDLYTLENGKLKHLKNLNRWMS